MLSCARTCACSYNLAYRKSSPFYNPLNDLGTPVAETGDNDRVEQVFLDKGRVISGVEFLSRNLKIKKNKCSVLSRKNRKKL